MTLLKCILFIYFPLVVSAQTKEDTISQTTKINLMKSYSIMNGVVAKQNRFGDFTKEMKSLGETISKNQLIAEYSFQWNYDQSIGYNIIGSVINNVLNTKKTQSVD